MQTDRSLVQNSALTLQRVDVHSNSLHVALQIICTFLLIAKQNTQNQRGILHHLCLRSPFLRTAMRVMKANRRCN